MIPIAAMLCALSSGLACADEGGAPRELRIGVGVDVVKKSSMAMASVKLGPLAVLAWDNDNYGIGATWDFGSRVGWNGGIGGFLARRTDDDLGTRLNLLFRGSFCSEKVCVSLAHLSHGAAAGIAAGKANSGLNFLFVEYRNFAR
jgi:hypothetical protein